MIFSSMFLRALRVSCPEFLEAEIGKIRNIGQVLKYPSHFLDTAFNKAKKTFYGCTVNRNFDFNNLLVLPFYPTFTQVPEMLKTFGVTVIFKNNTLKDMLIKNSPKQINGCIYEIPCNQCNKRYVGQSGKELATRIKQHKYNVRTGSMDSSLFQHMNNEDHSINWTAAKEIMYCKDFLKRNVIESCIIKKKYRELLNTSPGLYKLDELLIDNIFKQLAFK